MAESRRTDRYTREALRAEARASVRTAGSVFTTGLIGGPVVFAPVYVPVALVLMWASEALFGLDAGTAVGGAAVIIALIAAVAVLAAVAWFLARAAGLGMLSLMATRGDLRAHTQAAERSLLRAGAEAPDELSATLAEIRERSRNELADAERLARAAEEVGADRH